ncbi:MAG: hypothetical protein LBM96_00680 [Methanobrevibacter sp.]|jgi:hypothetical protein|nr:hypothetical protein [Candidatus Methanoflexus mossambicus]
MVFLEELIKGKNQFHTITVKDIDDKITARELTVLETKKMNRILMSAANDMSFEDLLKNQIPEEMEENTVKQIKVNLGEFEYKNYAASIYLIKTAFRVNGKQLTEEIAENLPEDVALEFMSAYNDFFQGKQMDKGNKEE